MFKFRFFCTLIAVCAQAAFAESFIIDGRNAQKNEYPAVISLEIFSGNQMSICTATFISDNTLLTAAHCLYEHENNDFILPPGFNIKKTFVHSAYKKIKDDEKNGVRGFEYLKMAYDVALIVLDGEKSKFIMPHSVYPKKIKSIIVGFGGKNLLTVAQMNKKTDETIGIKRVGTLDIESINTLGRIDSSTRIFNARAWYHFFDRYSASYGSKNSVSTRGDSGGPLIQNGKVVGVIAGSDAKNQNEFTVYSTTNYFAGLHSAAFKELVDEAKNAGSTLH
jgi:hypothetical protein